MSPLHRPIPMLAALTLAVGVILCGALHAAPASANTDTAKLQKLHAAFLLNFMKFTEWPEGSDAPFRVLVIDNDGFAQVVSKITGGRTVQDRAVTTENSPPFPAANDDDAWGPWLAHALAHDVIYAPADRPEGLRRLTQAAAGRPVLVVADRPEGIPVGSMLAFDLDSGRVTFHAKRSAIEASALRVRAPLLKLAQMHD